jgi:Tol biopolymer transport system component
MSRRLVAAPLVAMLALAVGSTPAFAADPVSRYDDTGIAGRSGGTPADDGSAAQGTAPQSAPGANGKIVFAVSPHGGWPSQLWRMNSDGTGKTRLTTHSVGIGDNWPEWSPGGTLVTFTRDMTTSTVDGGEDIFTIKANGSGAKRLTNTVASDYSSVFSPDGSRIAFTSERSGNPEIYTMNIDGSGVRRLTNHPAYDSQADWSPDGSRIAFVSSRSGQTEIYTMKPDGTGVQRLTNRAGSDFAPSWSPDGTRIAYSSDRNVDGKLHIYAMDPDGANPVWLDTDTGNNAIRASWSPDGAWIVFDTIPTSNLDVYRVLVADGIGQQLAQSADDEVAPSWQPLPAFPLVDARFSPFRGNIEYIFNKGITLGCSAERYCPLDAVTRGQMASFLVRALGLPATSTDYFTDDENSSHEDDINRLRAAGITSGCSATKYCPKANVTREQMATFLTKGFKLPRTTTDYFTDDENSSHEGSINRVRAAGITVGCTATRYCPENVVTRGQMAAFLRRALEN